MKGIIKTIALLISAVMLLSLAACTDNKPIDANVPTEAPTEATTEVPTEAPTPEPTEAPTEAPTPEPTEVPAPTPMPTEVPVMPEPVGNGDFFTLIRCNQPMIVDMDGDGADDIVLVSSVHEEWDDWYCTYVVTITRAADPEHPYTYETDSGVYGLLGCIADCDPADPQKELIISFDQEDFDPLTYAFRFKDDGSGFESFVEPILFIDYAPNFRGLPDDFVYHADEGLYIERRTEILGTFFVSNRITVTKDGFKLLSDEFFYNTSWELTLMKDLKLTLENGKTVTVKKDAVVIPYSTDRETFVKVKLEDGRMARAEVTFGDPEDHFPVYINGVEQDDAFTEIPYAD